MDLPMDCHIHISHFSWRRTIILVSPRYCMVIIPHHQHLVQLSTRSRTSSRWWIIRSHLMVRTSRRFILRIVEIKLRQRKFPQFQIASRCILAILEHIHTFTSVEASQSSEVPWVPSSDLPRTLECPTPKSPLTIAQGYHLVCRHCSLSLRLDLLKS